MSKLERLYPEIGAGGFSRSDGSVAFYSRVNALLDPAMVVLDLGAGRGQQLVDGAVPYRARLATLRGKVARVVGADVDPAVRENPFIDEAVVFDPAQPLPFADATFDLIVSDWVIEHIDDADTFASEVHRILKPGGWFCARTPNRWGMTGLAVNLIPNRLHARILAVVQPHRKEIDVFPTRYRLNTLGQIRRRFGDRFDHFSYVANAEPPYVQRSMLAMHLVKAAWRLLPRSMHTVLHVFLRKR